MKSRKVLLGLILGFCCCLAGTVNAQKANYQNNKLVEIGPDNIGGRVTSLVVFSHNNETDEGVLYAGAATGGLYTRVDNNDDAIWEYIPCYDGNEELTLPISKLVKLNDSILVVATGESYYAKGNKGVKMAALGRGIFLFNVNDKSFTRISNTNPGTNLEHNFASVNDMALVTLQGTTYFYVATPKGLFRWNVTSLSDFNSAPTTVFNGSVSNIVVSKQYNRAFFAHEGNLYKISDVINASTPVNITSSCDGFANAAYITLALAPSDESYLYAMASNENGLMQGLYLTRNTNSWTLLSSSTVTPFTSVATNKTCGALTVSPNDPTKIYVGGANVWVGKGYVEGSPYQWTISSSNENSLNYGDYMSTVFSNSAFVHSGVHQIVPSTYWVEYDGSYTQLETYYICTEGGVYEAANSDMTYFLNYNRGMNSVQINGLAVCPDGSIISGANANACPFIEARVDHNGGANDSTWYDGSGSNTNHLANIIWEGNGGQVAASRFTQYSPLSRRTIFVSSASANIDRAYKDFNDYTNTQTWTSGESFMSDLVENGPAIGQIYLWETDHNTVTNDSLTFTIDTLSYIRRNGTQMDLSQNFQVKAGDSIVVLDPAHASYPFYYVFDHNFTVKNEMRHTIPQPYLSRLLAVTTETGFSQNTNVSLCWVPTDFRKVFDGDNTTRFWSHIYGVNSALVKNNVVRYTAMSQDGDCAFVVVENTATNKSFIARVHGINSVDYSLAVNEIRDKLNYKISTRVTTTDTIQGCDTSIFFNRRISSIAVDPREGHDGLVVTFDGYNNSEANVLYIDNATADNYQVVNLSTTDPQIPVYSAMVEYTKGELYIGTEEGVFKNASTTAANWSVYGAFKGVPVTSMYQVTEDYPCISYTGHDGVTEVGYVFPRTKWSKAMYFGTYGRGIFMDSTYVVDHTNEIVTPDIYLGIPTVSGNGQNAVRFYPNPAVDNTTMELSIAKAGNAVIRIYDLTGKVVYSENLGRVAEGTSTRTINCQNLRHGMYLVNVIVNGEKATSKLVVK